jgi:hypothetical protein
MTEKPFIPNPEDFNSRKNENSFEDFESKTSHILKNVDEQLKKIKKKEKEG